MHSWHWKYFQQNVIILLNAFFEVCTSELNDIQLRGLVYIISTFHYIGECGTNET